MPDEEQFTMTVVQTKRRPRSGSEPAAEPEHGSHSGGHRSAHHQDSGGAHHSRSGGAHHGSADESAHAVHHRHYNDFGTENLGVMDEARVPEPADAQAEPTRGELQRAFYDKYDAALKRRYRAGSQNRVVRFLAVAALLAMIVLLLAFALSSLGLQTAETLPVPEVETIPIVTLDQ